MIQAATVTPADTTKFAQEPTLLAAVDDFQAEVT
jgi:hypothetical protein